MPIKEFIAIIYTTVMTISALHMPEPLLPLLAGSLKVEMDTIPLIMSATYIPLTIIPLISGIMLKFLSPKNMILLATLIHSLVCFFYFYCRKSLFSHLFEIYRGFFNLSYSYFKYHLYCIKICTGKNSIFYFILYCLYHNWWIVWKDF